MMMFQVESFLLAHDSNLPLPPASGLETIFEFVVDDKGQWEHWKNRVCHHILHVFKGAFVTVFHLIMITS